MLALIYSQGIFKGSDKENKKFRELINQEAKKRHIKPLELIDYLADHRTELLQLLEKKDLKYKKFQKTYIHKDMEKLMHELMVGKKLTNKGTQNINIPAIDKERITGEVMTWENKGVEYFVKVENLIKLEDKNPKVFTGQI